MSRAHLRVSSLNFPLNPSIGISITKNITTRTSTSTSYYYHLTTHPSPHHPLITIPHIPNHFTLFSRSRELSMTRRGAYSNSGGAYSNGRAGSGQGRSGGSGGRPPQSREVTVSRNLSYLLRHHAADEGILLDEGGWAGVGDVVGLFFDFGFNCFCFICWG